MILNKILATSATGSTAQKITYSAYWSVRPSPPTIGVTGKSTIERSYKSSTKKSDFRSPTNYTRMIGKIVPGPGADCWNNVYSYKSEISAESLYAWPHGSDYGNAVVGCPTWMVDKVLLDALADMNQLNANILEDLGQLRQTGELIASLYNSMINLFRLALAGNWKAIRRLLRYKHGVNVPRSVAKGWLVYFYGIKPLISTIEALTSNESTLYKTLKVRKRVSQNVSALPYFNGRYYHQFSGSAKIQAQCELKAKIKLAGNLASWQDLGLTSSGLTDLVVTGYALVPYSFVVDWFIPIENWLRTLVWSPFLEYQGGFTGKRHYVRGSVTNLAPWSGKWPYSGQLPKCQLLVTFYKRETYPYTVPSAALGIRLSLSPTQIVSATALLTAIPRF